MRGGDKGSRTHGCGRDRKGGESKRREREREKKRKRGREERDGGGEKESEKKEGQVSVPYGIVLGIISHTATPAPQGCLLEYSQFLTHDTVIITKQE